MKPFKRPTKDEWTQIVREAAIVNNCLCVKGRLDGQGNSVGVYALKTGKLVQIRVCEFNLMREILKSESLVGEIMEKEE